jgi:hypothetical protein
MAQSFVCLVFVVTLTLLLPSDGDVTLNGRQNVLLQHAVKTLLGFSEVPSSSSSRKARSAVPDPGAAPKYMLDLYEQYKYGSISNGKKSGNTVRSITAQIGVVNEQHMFIFNMSSVTSSERVFSGEVHLYRKKLKTRAETPNIVMKLHEVAPTYLSEVDNFLLHARGHGWHSYDVTTAIKSCLSTKRESPHLMALSLEWENQMVIPLQKFMQNAYRPFLIIFSNDTQNITLDHMDPYFNPSGLKDPLIDPETGGTVKNRKKNRQNKPPINKDQVKGIINIEDDAIELGNKISDIKSPKLSDIFRRHRRSIFDNEIPQEAYDNDETQIVLNVPIAVPKDHILLDHANKVAATKREEEEYTKTIKEKTNKVKESSRLIPYPENYNRNKKRRRSGKRKGRKSRNREERNRDIGDIIPFPEDWDVESSHPAPSSGTTDQLCGRRKLVVDFADIGWSDWIISPTSFEAHYCAGKCPFPLTKGVRPSNHATIQSLVHAIGIQTDVPAPCCVPDALSSVTLLYFDENGNVVLKNYPAMTVQSCACR